MPVVSNTSPILNLAIIERLDLLRRQFDQVVIPDAVREELRPETDFPGSAAVRGALEAGWLQMSTLATPRLAQVLQLGLDRGESEAIALAIELEARLLLLDEKDARSKAKSLGLEPVGVLGVLLRAKRAGDLPVIAPELERLRREAGFYVADELVVQVLSEAGEL
jgi:uncharacterized protein